MKDLFLKKISRCFNNDAVAYLHYKLRCYEGIDIDVRARELEARYDPDVLDAQASRTDFPFLIQ